jgi:hypothetical protein
MRLVAGLALVDHGITGLQGEPPLGRVIVFVLATAAGTLLLGCMAVAKSDVALSGSRRRGRPRFPQKGWLLSIMRLSPNVGGPRGSKRPERLLHFGDRNPKSLGRVWSLTKTRSQKLTSIVTGPTASSGRQLTETIDDWLFGLVETHVP